MKTTPQALARLNRELVRALKALLVLLFLVLVIDVSWGVGSRYLFNAQAPWSEELARLLMVWLALMGAALVCREDRHLGLDVVVRSWPADVQRLARLAVYVLILVFACGIMAWGGFQIVFQRFESGQTLPALGVSRGWFYLALPVSGILTTSFMIEAFLTTLFEIGEPRDKEPS